MHADECQAACRPCNQVAESISTGASIKEFLFVLRDQFHVLLYEFLWHAGLDAVGTGTVRRSACRPDTGQCQSVNITRL